MGDLPVGSAYDALGHGYAQTRVPDPRIQAQVWRALGNAATVVNVGAGTGSYEPPTTILAVEPSAVMAAQRPAGMAPVAITDATRIPLPDDAVDAALAVLTIHHWPDLEAGIAELRRVARRIVILTWDDRVTSQFRLFRDYLPTAAALDHELCVPISRLTELLGKARVETVPVPHDCLDGFACAYWRRPEAYLDARIRANITSLVRIESSLSAGLDRLTTDLTSRRWHGRNKDLLDLDEIDLGYRLVMADEAIVGARLPLVRRGTGARMRPRLCEGLAPPALDASRTASRPPSARSRQPACWVVITLRPREWVVEAAFLGPSRARGRGRVGPRTRRAIRQSDLLVRRHSRRGHSLEGRPAR